MSQLYCSQKLFVSQRGQGVIRKYVQAQENMTELRCLSRFFSITCFQRFSEGAPCFKHKLIPAHLVYYFFFIPQKHANISFPWGLDSAWSETNGSFIANRHWHANLVGLTAWSTKWTQTVPIKTHWFLFWLSRQTNWVKQFVVVVVFKLQSQRSMLDSNCLSPFRCISGGYDLLLIM